MPGPSAAFLAAVRSGNAARHLLFEMSHSAGTVRAWSGRGELVYDGNTYLGVYGLGSIGALEASRELQNHEVQVALNSIPLSAIEGVDPDVRNNPATVRAVWLREDTGELLPDTVVLFAGRADYIAVTRKDDTASIMVVLRSPMADWSAAPGRYYTDADQQREYPSDDGFKFMRELENATAIGWKLTPDTAIDWVEWDAALGRFRGAESKRCIVDHTYGAVLGVNAYGLPRSVFDDAARYQEQTSDALAPVRGGYLTVAGERCYVDTAGVVRTTGGLKVLAGTGRYMRALPVAAVGSAGATKPGPANAAPEGGGNVLITINNADVTWLADAPLLVIDNEDGNVVRGVGTGSPLRHIVKAADYVEDGTGAAVTYSSASGKLQVAGVDCTISSTGVVRTPAGNTVRLSGYTASRFFLRTLT